MIITIIKGANTTCLSYIFSIRNPDNYDFVDSIKANYDMSNEDIQLEYCWRNWDKLDKPTKNWFMDQLK